MAAAGRTGSAPDRFRTRGHRAAVAVVDRWIRLGSPQAVLVSGPARVGKTTLALDLAAGVLCAAPEPAARPCRACRPCRQVEAGTHQDLHLLAPAGAGRQVLIGRPDVLEPGTARWLLHELARRPVEGPGRVAIVEEAHRLSEDVQNVLLKTLEEPPAGAVLVLCADEADRLLPTIRSRTASLRLGPASTRAIEELLAERGVDPPRAAQLARLAAGRPGLALAYAAEPAAIGTRAEIARSLLDLLAADRTSRLVGIRAILLRSADLGRLDGGRDGGRAVGFGDEESLEGRAGTTMEVAESVEGAAPAGGDSPAARRSGETPAERRRAARALLEIWLDVARDMAIVAAGGRAAVRDPTLLDDLDAASSRLPPGSAAAFLPQLAAVAEQLEANANPELAVDVLVLAWPRLS